MTREEAIAELEHILPRTSAIQLAIDSINNDLTIKKVYDKGYKDGQKALAVHLELCKEEGNCDYYDSYNQTCRRSDVPKEPCEDCISREEVCDYIAEFVNHEYATDREHELVEHIIGGIQHLPGIQPTTDVLDKIRAEIEHLTITEGGEDYVRTMAELYSLKIKVLQIIDKYRTEREDKK